MENNTEKLDIYRFINSKDVAEHCRRINHQFSTTEMAKLIYMSRLPDEEKMQGYKWLIENAPDDTIPNEYLFIPHFALWGGKKVREKRFTKEEIRTRTKVFKGRESVLNYLSECTASGSFIDLKDGCNTLKSIDVHIPHPFKFGDLLENIITHETYIVERVGDVVEIMGQKSRSQFCFSLRRKGEENKPNYIISMEVSDLSYYLPSVDFSDWKKTEIEALNEYLGSTDMFKEADENGYYTYEIEGLKIQVKPTGDYNFELIFNDGNATENALEVVGDTISDTLKFWLNNNDEDMDKLWEEYYANKRD